MEMQKFRNEMALREKEHLAKMEQMRLQHELAMQQHHLEIDKHKHAQAVDEASARTERMKLDPQGAAAQSVIEDRLTPLLQGLHAALTSPLQVHRGADGRIIGASRRTN
jgi:hypothetical protein